MAKHKEKNQPGRAELKGRFTTITLFTVSCFAWKDLPLSAHSLYIILKLEWKGAKYNNNGKITLSTRQAAKKMGCSINTAARAFRELQAKGFIVVTRAAVLGIKGEARAPTYELTELGMPGEAIPRKLYLQWRQGKDFPIISTKSNNPTGKNGRNSPLSKR